jgi:hypothetical protein
MDSLVVEAFEFHAAEPAGEDVLANLGTKPTSHAEPLLLVGGDHVLVSLRVALMEDADDDAAQAPTRQRQVFAGRGAASNDDEQERGIAETASMHPYERGPTLLVGLLALNRLPPAIGAREG